MERRTEKEIREYINEKINKPETLKKVFSRLKRNSKFRFLKYEAFYYNVKKLIDKGKIKSTLSSDFHPKKKPSILIFSEKQLLTN